MSEFKIDGAVLPAERLNGLRLPLGALIIAVQFDEQDGPCVGWEADFKMSLHRLDAKLIDELKGRRQNPRSKNGRYGVGGPGRIGESGQHGSDSRGYRDQADRHLGGDAKGPFRADQEGGERGSRLGQIGTAKRGHLTIGHDHGLAEHMIQRDALFQGMWAAGVFGHVTADGTGRLAGGVRGKLQAVGAGL